MHTADELIECKTVLKGNKQITIKGPYLRGLVYAAAIQGKTPLLHIELEGMHWVMRLEGDYVDDTG